MTRDDIDNTLAAAMKEAMDLSSHEAVGHHVRELACAVVALVKVVEAQEARLRAVEACPRKPRIYQDGRHAWRDDGACAWCDARRPE